MKIVEGSLTDEGEKVDFQGPQHEITEQNVEMHLLIIAVDSEIPTEIKSATYNFANRKEGLQAFNILAATARNIHKTSVEDVKLYQTVKMRNHHT